MDYLTYDGMQVPYRFVTSNRKTISIQVSAEGVTIRAPRTMTKDAAMKLAHTKLKWIVKHYKQMQQRNLISPIKQLHEGSEVLYRGMTKTLQYEKLATTSKGNQKDYVRLEGDRIYVATTEHTSDSIRAILEAWYREEARTRLLQRIQYYCNQYDFGKSVNRVYIKDQKSRWGSCSSKCNLNFNYRLILAPDDVLDYIVVHELCHLKHMNHSVQFWNAVEEILPQYQTSKQWLRDHGASLQW